MEAEGIAQSAISAFESTFNSLVSGNTGIIPESTISPVPELVHTDSISAEPDASLLSSTVVLKLNGGLGTGMGLDKAKSLLEVKNGDTFLDLTAKQVICMREEFGQKVKFMLMNSFSTSDDTLEFFRSKYPSLAAEEGLEMLQNKVPKLDATTYEVRLDITLFGCIDSECQDTNLIIYCLYIYIHFYSPELVPPTQATNGAHPAMETCTPPSSAPAA